MKYYLNHTVILCEEGHSPTRLHVTKVVLFGTLDQRFEPGSDEQLKFMKPEVNTQKYVVLKTVIIVL